MTIQEQYSHHATRLAILQKQTNKLQGLMKSLPDDHPGKWKLKGYAGRYYLKWEELAIRGLNLVRRMAQVLMDTMKPVPKYPIGSSHPGGPAIVGEPVSGVFERGDEFTWNKLMPLPDGTKVKIQRHD